MACARKWLVTAGLLVAVLLTGPVATQPQFEIVERGSIDPTVIHAVREATPYSLASLAQLGVILTQPPKVYVCATKADYADVLVELGLFDRPAAERRSGMYSGQSALGAFVLNVEYIGTYAPRVADQVWWVVPHEVFHLYQRQSRMERRGTPFAFWEGPAELHKFKVLGERQIINFERYVKATVIPRSQDARRRQSAFSIRQTGISASDAQTLGDFYRIAAALGVYMLEKGGWPKIVALYSAGDVMFPTQFRAVWGRSVEEFEVEFFAWLDAQ
jgi:hypothetical protein